MPAPASASENENVNVVDEMARCCGHVVVGCADAAGAVTIVSGQMDEQLATLAKLEEVTSALDDDQGRVTEATDEARIISEDVRGRLLNGTELIKTSIGEFELIVDIVAALGSKITSLAAALEQVHKVSKTIDEIARKTNILALNATIEAERAGDAGKTFAVVASEVKLLSQQTRTATEEIARTTASVTREAESVIGDISHGVEKGSAVRGRFTDIGCTLDEVASMVQQLDQQTDSIASSTSFIRSCVGQMRGGLTEFADAARSNGMLLRDAHGRVIAAEQTSNVMFDSLIHGGFATFDSHFVDLAIAERDRIETLTNAALSSGELSPDVLFDDNYIPVAGSAVEKFTNRLNAFADAHWRPELDRASARDPRIVVAVCTDRRGYLPTHMTRLSLAESGNVQSDLVFSRNRIFIFGETDKVAKASNKKFHMGVYRRETENGGFQVVRNVYVPLHFQGRRWGDYEIAYVIDD